MNFKENLTHVESTFREKNDYFYESFYNNEHRIINYSFLFFSNKMNIRLIRISQYAF